MTAIELRKRIESILTDVVFEYHGKAGCINPWNDHKFEVGFNNEIFRTYNNIEDVMKDPIYDGKCLNEIAEELDVD